MSNNPVFLLGAGASQDAGLPVANELTEKIVKDLNNNPNRNRQNLRLHEVMNYIVGTMISHRGKSGISPGEMPDIESVVSAVELLKNRTRVELVPFIQNWDPAVETLDRKGSWNPGWEDDVRKGILGVNAGDYRSLQVGLKGFMEENYQMGVSGDRYSSLMTELLNQLKRQLEIPDPTSTQYLNPLVEIGKQGRVTIATINYDLSIETAANLREIQYSRGISKWNAEWKLEWSESGIQLIKLHGSIDWGKIRRTNPENKIQLLQSEFVISEMKEPLAEQTEPFVVYGKREKLRPEGPFFELRSEFIYELRKSSHLVVIGYSFGDDHINEIIQKWLNSDPSRRLVIVDPKFPTRWTASRNPFQERILRDLIKIRSALEGDIAETRVLIMNKTAKDALPDLCQGSDHIDHLFNELLNKTDTDK